MSSPELLSFTVWANKWLTLTYIPLIKRDIREIQEMLERLWYTWYHTGEVDDLMYVLGNVLLRTLLLYRWMELQECLAWAAFTQTHALLYDFDVNQVDLGDPDD